MTGVAFVVAAGMALVVFVSLANVVTMTFTRGAVRAAIEEGARVGARSDDPVAACEDRARAVLRGLLGPASRDAVTVSCVVAGTPPSVRAHADARLAPWWPGVPAFAFATDASSLQEALP
jgi:propanediol dehydratase large subunit